MTFCSACGGYMRLLSKPRPDYVEQCTECKSTFFSFGRDTVSHSELYSNKDNYQYYLDVINESTASQRYEEALDRIAGLQVGKNIFDIGAGSGVFLEKARDRGFEVAGNEVSQPAIAASRELGIELYFGDDLRSVPGAGEYDAASMWCVIAHVDDPDELLQGVRALLRPGGVLFFSTPRYCLIDRIAWLIHPVDRRVFDRRINRAHRRQYTKRGMEALLARHGFDVISVEPLVGYGLHMEAYLTAVGVPHPVAVRAGKVLDWSAGKGWLPRNILMVYAQT